MKHLSLTLVSAAALLFGATGCNTAKKNVTQVAGPVATETVKQTNAAVHKVIYGEWVAYKVGDQLVTGTDRPYIIFNGDNGDAPSNYVKAYGNDGCNIINGAYEITPGGKGKMVPVAQLISTMRMCPDAPYEMGMALALNNVSSFELDKIGNDYLLNMKDKDGATLMVLRKYDLNFINGAWDVTAINGEKVPATSELQLVIDTPEQKVHGNVGCNTMNGSIVLNPDLQNSISFTNMMTTRMTCPDIATEQALLTALSKVKSVTPIDDMAGAALKDEAGNTVVMLKRVQLR